MSKSSQTGNGRCNPLHNTAIGMSAVFFREQPGIFCKCLFSKEQNSSSVVFPMFSFPPTFHIMPVCVESTIFFSSVYLWHIS